MRCFLYRSLFFVFFLSGVVYGKENFFLDTQGKLSAPETLSEALKVEEAKKTSSRSIASLEEEKGRYDFQWLDPDKKVYVLQNRLYPKKGRVLFSILGGRGLSQAYLSSWAVEGRVGFYFLEDWGVELFYERNFRSRNNAFRALEFSSPGALPVVREVVSRYGLLGQWSPWYAKINIFNTIFYFDWYFSLGGGVLETQLDTRTLVSSPSNYVTFRRFGIFFGTGHQFHFADLFVVRLDLTGAYFQAPLFGTSGEKTWFPDFVFSLGFGLRL